MEIFGVITILHPQAIHHTVFNVKLAIIETDKEIFLLRVGNTHAILHLIICVLKEKYAFQMTATSRLLTRIYLY